MRLHGIAFALLAMTACSTHRTDQCWEACDAGDQADFVDCVANGDGDCEAGNRACCARDQECVGMLEDQRVETTRTGCMFADEMFCEPACTPTNEASYELCLMMGNASCSPGDDLCCALAEPCLGQLGDVRVSAEGCCTDDDDCDDGERCEVVMGMCYPTDVCGDHVMSGDEECDEGPEPTLDCTYGAMSCMVCSIDCEYIAGTTSFCGDGTTDTFHGEGCDPPGTATCDATCQRIIPATCRDSRLSPGETDIDCGGTECLACAPGERCRLDTDCGLRDPGCDGTPFCEPAMGMCTVLDECDDFDSCTSDLCEGGGAGCIYFNMFDSDMDGDGAAGTGCGMDCNDSDDTVSSLLVDDFGCPTGSDPEDRVNNDCDSMTDESGCR